MNSENCKNFIAFTTKGLERITEKEIKTEFPQASIIEVLTKRVIFSTDAPPKELLKLKTVDDIHFLVKFFKDVESLDENFILKHLPLNETKEALKFISQFRKLNKNFSLTLSKYKNTSIDLDSISLQISENMEKALEMEYTPRERTNFDFRVHIDGSNLSFSCRLTEISLYNRTYRKCELKGALKPTVAAALCLLISPSKGEKVVDNFCGTGTILCEAFLQGLEPYGGDLNDESVDCARQNMKNLSQEYIKNIKILDAKSTKWDNSYFDYAISNLPWGKQVDLKGTVKLYSASIAEYARILKKEGSIVLLGMKSDLLVKHLKKNFPNHKIIKFKIGFLGQNPWVVCALSQNKPEINL